MGIDLALKEWAAFSDGGKEKAQQIYRELESELADSAAPTQRNGARRSIPGSPTAKRLFAQALPRLVTAHGFIAVGNVNAAKLAKTSRGKSMLDAGRSSRKDMLTFEAVAHGRSSWKQTKHLPL